VPRPRGRAPTGPLQDVAGAADKPFVAPDSHTRTAASAEWPELVHCPHCRGAVRPDAPWCTQCWAGLRPAPEPEPAPVARHAAPDPAPPLSAVDGPGRSAAGWPCSACGVTNGVELDACSGCGTGFLATLRADEPPLLLLPGVGDVTRLGRAQRLGLGAAVALTAVLLVLLVGVLVG
jgi:hypothetical protein